MNDERWLCYNMRTSDSGLLVLLEVVVDKAQNKRRLERHHMLAALRLMLALVAVHRRG